MGWRCKVRHHNQEISSVAAQGKKKIGPTRFSVAYVIIIYHVMHDNSKRTIPCLKIVIG